MSTQLVEPSAAGDAAVNAESEDLADKSPATGMFTIRVVCVFAAAPSSPAEAQTSDDGQQQPKDQAPKRRLKGVVLTNMTLQAPDFETFCRQTTLSQTKTQLLKSYPRATPFRFCTETGGMAAESMTLADYFASLVKRPNAEDASFNIYMTALNSGNPNESIIFLLRHSSFCLKFMRLVDTSNSVVEGSLDSSIFKGKSALTTTLNTIRAFVKTMSVDHKQDTFCLPDGTPIEDIISLEQYLGMAQPAISEKDKVPTIAIFLKKTSLAVIQPTNSLVAGSSGTGGHAGGQNGGQSKSSDLGKVDPSVVSKLGKLDLAFSDRSKDELHRDTNKFKVTEALHEKDYAAAAGGTVIHASKLNEDEWDHVLRNCNAFYGWIIDFKGNKIKRAPHASFRLKRGLNVEKAITKYEGATGAPQHYENDELTETNLQPLKLEDARGYVPKKAPGIPSFLVTDDTSIEVASVLHEFSMSMAENHFDKTTFEAEASGVFEGVTIGVQGGVAEENQSGRKGSEGKITSTLVATYKVPRATVYLSAADLEPTDEFTEAIHKIRESKNLLDLRRLHGMFGQIFCTEIVIGGCLQTSKVLDAAELQSESLSRNKFKGSVGLAVGIPDLGSGSMKASHETQDHSESGSRMFNQRESLSFSATGGNTILASNPPAWLNTVGSEFSNWRVIQQRDLKPVMDVVSDMPGFEMVRLWFLQAVPNLSKYIVVPPSRCIDARFKVALSSEGLARAIDPTLAADIGLVRGRTGGNIQTYLAHDPERPPIHVRTFVKQVQKPVGSVIQFPTALMKQMYDATGILCQTTETSSHAIFQPVSTQLAVLLDPRAHSVGSPDDKTPPVDKRTIWTMEVPDGYSLKHNSIVTLKSRAKDTPGMDLTLTVYRNSQGIFMPSITSNPDPVYWRVLKVNSSSEADADQLKFGDTVRLCWRFSDQLSGWRDYFDDFYGRRQFGLPKELRPEEDCLFFKAPFPRFEALNDPQGMSILLSPSATTGPILENLTLREKNGGTVNASYNLFDLSFRLDFVGNNGFGEALDYMNVVRDDDTVTTVANIQQGLTVALAQPQSPADIGDRMVGNLVNSYKKQLGDLGDAIKSGSPTDVLKQSFNTVGKFSGMGLAAAPLGF